jgi:acetyl-CoA C-acetyltransferase
MTIKGKAFIAGAWEHPTRYAPDKSIAQIHAECALGALRDAGLTARDVDGYFCAGDAPGASTVSMAEYLNLHLSYMDGTDLGGCSAIAQVGHAAAAIAMGKCSVALITLGGKPKARGQTIGTKPRPPDPDQPQATWDYPYKWNITGIYGNIAQRHMHEYGTTSEQMAWVKVAASHHAQHNPHALLQNVVTVQDVLDSPMIADPIHRLDCCVITDGGGALVVVKPEIARALKRPLVKVLGSGETYKTNQGGYLDYGITGAVRSGAQAYAEAGVTARDIQYASIYDNFTISVIMQLEDMGFCEKGQGGRFVADGNLISGVGRLPINTDGGGLCNNHPSNRGGITKVIEAVRQLRGEAHPAVQVPNCRLALACGPGIILGDGHNHASVIMERE